MITTRRSARCFKSDPIPDEVLAEILDAGRLAPSPGNCQSWYFGIVKDAELCRQLAHAAGNQTWIASAPVIIALCARLSWHLDPLPEDDFGLVVSHTRYGKAFWTYLQAYPDRKAIGALLEEWTVSTAGEHIFLAAVNHGLRACWVGFLDVQRASQILGLSDDLVCEYIMPVGYPAEPPVEIERRHLENVVFTDR